jgi:uncharacterized protein (DUF58 family)
MIPPEVMHKIRQIQIFTNRTVNDIFAGEYHSSFKGQGMAFDEVREYQPGDDVRSIDWNVTARMNKPFIKRYIEEREQTVMLLVDLSASGAFGSVGQFKNEIATELCAVIAFSAIKNNDKVGLITFTDRIEKFIPPGKGTQHVLRVIRELLYHETPHAATDIAMALDYLANVIKKKATVFVVSDFIDKDISTSLRQVNRRHDLIAVTVRDQWEETLPKVGLIELVDPETDQLCLVDTTAKRVRQNYESMCAKRFEEKEYMFRATKVDTINITTARPYIPELVRFFKMRGKRR